MCSGRVHWGYAWAPNRFSERLAARATDVAGRQSVAKVQADLPPSAGLLGVPAPLPPSVLLPSPPARLDPLRAPVARSAVGRRSTRVRSLVAPWLPRGGTATVRCRGPRCPFARRARRQRRPGQMDLTAMLSRRRLTPRTTITVTLSAAGRQGRGTRWTVRSRRSPRRIAVRP